MPFVRWIDRASGALLLAICTGVLAGCSEGSRCSPLSRFHEFVMRGEYSDAKRVIDEQPEVAEQSDAFGYTALHYAAIRGRTTLVQMLLDKGANANAVTRSGRSVLLDAALSTNAEPTVRLLLEHGAKVDIYSACAIGDMKAVEDYKGDLNVTVSGWLTPLDIAAFRGRTEVIKLLLSRGALLRRGDDGHPSALQLALDAGKKEAAEILRKQNANLGEDAAQRGPTSHSARLLIPLDPGRESAPSVDEN